MENLYPEMPEWFKAYLKDLPAEQKAGLTVWVNQEGSDCALDMMTEALGA